MQLTYKHLRNNLYRITLAAGVLGLCAVLAGCPMASNPSQGSGKSAPSVPGAGKSPIPSAGGSPLPGGGVGMPGGSPDGSIHGKPDGSPNGVPQGTADSGSTEPGFDPANGTEGLPDLSDNEPVARSKRTPGYGQSDGSGSGAGSAEGPGAGSGEEPGSTHSTAKGASSASTAANSTGGDGTSQVTGPMTHAEQVAVLDAELERATGEFDDLILKEQAEQRRQEREQASQAQSNAPDPTAPPTQASRGGGGYGGGMASGTGGGSAPTNPVKFPPPQDIPDGDNDDVVARQLREAAMREPDPAVREKLWDEYRKYKGID